MTGPVRVLVVDDDPLFGDTLATLLERDERLEVVGQARDGQDALDLTQKLRPDLVLMDITMPRIDGIEATRRIRKLVPSTLVLILSSSASGNDVRAASDAGAVGFLTKDALSSDIGSAILELAAFAGVTDV